MAWPILSNRPEAEGSCRNHVSESSHPAEASEAGPHEVTRLDTANKRHVMQQEQHKHQESEEPQLVRRHEANSEVTHRQAANRVYIQHSE